MTPLYGGLPGVGAVGVSEDDRKMMKNSSPNR